ncbi:major histocompatibility complex class I-related protein 1 [Pogona vitticeps]
MAFMNGEFRLAEGGNHPANGGKAARVSSGVARRNSPGLPQVDSESSEVRRLVLHLALLPRGKSRARSRRRMPRGRRLLSLLRWGAALLLLGGRLVGRGAAASHSLRYMGTVLPEATHGLPQFSLVGYVDDVVISRYDSTTRREWPQARWVKESMDAHFWDTKTQISKGDEQECEMALEMFQNHYNRSESFSCLQWTYGCELSDDGHKNGFDRLAYEGREVMYLNLETLTWVATSRAIPDVIRKWWNADKAYIESQKVYLEGECIELLQRYLGYGKELLLKKEPPVVKVLRRSDSGDQETLVCRVYGFYPKEIEATWRKDGEVWMEDTFHAGILLNSDGTYYTWLSVQIDPKDVGLYQCHVDHSGLDEPLAVAWEETDGTGLNTGLIILIVGAAALVLVMVVVGIILCLKRGRKHNVAYQIASVFDRTKSPLKVRKDPRELEVS